MDWLNVIKKVDHSVSLYPGVTQLSLENLSHWVRDQIKLLADTCKYRLQDTNDVIFWINKFSEKYAPFSQNTVSSIF